MPQRGARTETKQARSPPAPAATAAAHSSSAAAASSAQSPAVAASAQAHAAHDDDDDDDASPVSPQAGGGAVGGAATESKAKRKRRKQKDARQQQQQQHQQGSAVAVRGGGGAAVAHSHSHGGGASHGSHGDHGGHSHGHSHGGVACGGHGPEGGAGRDSRVSAEDMSEAVHYCDVLFHFTSYATHSFQRLERMQADFQVIPSVLQSLVPGHADRMGELRRAVRANHAFLMEIVSHRYVFQSSDDIDYERIEEKVQREHPVDEERMSKVRSTLRQCVRDWSAEGEAERRACYGPILAELERLYPDVQARAQVKVLVPGSGLGRLVWEVASRGFFAQGNEFSYFMLLCSFLLLNCCKAANVFTIYPYVHEAKNLLTPADQMRAVRIPDIDPTQLATTTGTLSMAAGDWMDIFSDLPSEYIHGSFARMQAREVRRAKRQVAHRRAWDAARKEHAKIAAIAVATGAPVPPAPELPDDVEEPVPDPVRHPGWTTGPLGEREAKPSNEGTWDVFASCYFIDCATNILEYLRTIAYLLKPGGYWINFGPLLYHFSEVPRETSVDLSWAELRAAAPAFGLTLVREELEQPSAYTSDERSMLRSHYYCVSCTWQKTGVDTTRAAGSSAAPMPPPPVSVAWQTRVAQMQADGWTTIAIPADTQTPSTDSSSTAGASSASSTSSSLSSSSSAASLSASLHGLLQSVGARTLASGVSLTDGTMLDLAQVPSAQVTALLLRAPEQAAVTRVEVAGVRMLAIINKP